MTDKTEAPELRDQIHDAKKVAYSSIVGQSIMLLNKSGACIGQLSVLNTTCPQDIADQVVAALKAPNRHAYKVGVAVGKAEARTDVCAEVKPSTRESVIDRIEQIVSATHDVDTTDRHYAENVFDECIDCISVAIRQEIEHARKEGYDAGYAQALKDAIEAVARKREANPAKNGEYSNAIFAIRTLNKEAGE